MAKKQYNQTPWQLLWSKWIVLLMVFFVPLYASTAHWYAFTTPKTLLVIGGTCLATILLIWAMVRDRDQSVRITYLHYILFGFLGVLSVASALGINPHQSFFGTFFSSTSIVLLIALAVFAWLIAEFTRRDSGFIRMVAQAVFWSGVTVAFITYLPYTNASWRLLEISGGSSMIGNSSFTGGFLLFAIAYGVYCMATMKKARVWYGLGIALILLCPMFFNADIWHGVVSLSQVLRTPTLLIGQAQGAFLGLAVAIIAALALYLLTTQKKSTKIIGGVIGSVLLLGLIFSYIGLLNPTSRIHQVFAATRTETRFVFWDIAGEALKERPLLGWGFQNYQSVYQQKFDPIIYSSGYAYEQWVTNPHNVLFDIGVSGGILGLLAYFVLFGATWWVCWRAANRDRSNRALIIAPAVLLGYFVQNLFIFDTPTTWLVYFITIGIALGIITTGKEIALRTTLHKSLAGIKIVGLVSVVIIFVFLPANESQQWLKASDLPLSAERIVLQERMQHISLMGSVDDDIVYAQKTFASLVGMRATLKPEEKDIYLQEIDSLIAMLARDAERYPDNFYVRYLAGSLIHLAYSTDPARGVEALDSARAYFDAARMISPANPKVYYNLAQNAIFRKDTATAIKLVQQGMALGANGEGEEILKRIQK